MIRAAIYARVSTDAQSENSIPDQIRECQNYIEKEGWEACDIYTDRAISGTDVSRAEYVRLKSDALTGKFDYIVVDDLSRIGRDMPEFTRLYQELTDVGVNIVGVADGIDTSKPSSKIPVYFKGIMNEIFLDDMKAKVLRGLKGQFLRGYSTGGRIYGYKTEPVFDPAGGFDKFGRPKRLGCRMRIDETQGKVIRRIFELRQSGLGYKAIVHILNSESIASPQAGTDGRKGSWNPSTVRSILINKKYTGVWEYNKTRWVKKRIGGQRKVLPNKPTDWEIFHSEDLRIVSDELFISVNSGIKQCSQRGKSGRKRYALSGLLICYQCGGSMVVQNSGTYSCLICNNARTLGSAVCESKTRILRSEVEQAVLSEVGKQLLNQPIVEEIVSRAKNIVRSHLRANKPDIRVLQKKEKAIKNQIEGLLDLAEKGRQSPALRERFTKREEELTKVKLEIAGTHDSPERIADVTAEWIKGKLITLRSLIEMKEERAFLLRNELQGLFPKKLTVTPVKVAGRVGFNITGAAQPFGPFSASILSKRCIAVRGIEPRFED